MQVIDQDPGQVIPNINEGIYNDKLLIAVLRSEGLGIYIARVHYTGTEYILKGNDRLNSEFNAWSMEPGTSVLHLITNLWWQYAQYYKIKFYILDNWQELSQVIQEAYQC